MQKMPFKLSPNTEIEKQGGKAYVISDLEEFKIIINEICKLQYR